MGNIHFTHDFREEPYSEGDKIPPCIKAVNMIKTFYSSIDKIVAAQADKVSMTAINELENIAQIKHGLFEFNYDEEYNFLMIKITLRSFIAENLPKSINLRTIYALANFVSIEPVDCEYISLNFIFNDIIL